MLVNRPQEKKEEEVIVGDQESKYNVVLNINIKIEKVNEDGTTAPFTSYGCPLTYNNMDYLQIVATQQSLVNFGQELVDLGWLQAKALGFENAEAVEEILKAKKEKKEK